MKKFFVMMLTLAMIFTMIPMASAATAAQDPDLVAYWSFDVLNADDTVDDLSGNGNTLTMKDTAREWTDGFSGKTFNFNGGSSTYDNSKHLVMSSDVLAEQVNGSEGLTFSYFMKKKTLESNLNFAMFSFYAGGYSAVAQAGKDAMTINSRSGAGGAAVTTTTTVEKIYANCHATNLPDPWIHVAFVLDYPNDNVKIYVDGVLVGEEQAEETPQKFVEDVASYKTDAGDAGYFGVGGRTTLVDEFKIYKRALTQDEIKESIPPVMSYNFEEVCDGTIKDLSGHGKDITVASDDSPAVLQGAGVNGSNTIRLTKAATLPADTFTKMFFGTKTYSVSFWVKTENSWGSVGAAYTYIMKDTPASGTGSLFSLSGNGKKFYLETRSRVNESVGYVQSPDLFGYTADPNWHHIYLEADFVNKTGKMYLDGVQKTLNNNSVSKAALSYVTGTLDNLTDIFDIASRKLLIDDLKVYRRTLTENEIKNEAKNLFYNISNTENSVTVNNIWGVANNNQIILAMYDKDTGALADCEMISALVYEQLADKSTKFNAQSITIDKIDAPQDYIYKLFVWNANNVPLKHLQTFTVSAQ